MPIVAVDDTDSRERGMCTTYVGTRLAERLEAAGARVRRRLLVRLNPAVKHKTRGNAAVALHVSGTDAESAFRLAEKTVTKFAAAADPRTSPGVVVADIDVEGDPFTRTDSVMPSASSTSAVTPTEAATTIPADVADFACRALRHRLSLDEAVAIVEAHGYHHAGFGAGGAGATSGADGTNGTNEPDVSTPDPNSVEGRGRIGALAAVGAPAAFDDWTVERISYRELDRCGTPRDVDAESVFVAADEGYPVVWDTVDRETGETVCVPNAPGPILHGIRGDDVTACRAVAEAITGERVERAATFLTNQGTDAHLATGRIGELRDGAGYRVAGVVASEPETKRGGHVHVDVVVPGTEPGADTGSGAEIGTETEPDPGDPTAEGDRLRCLAFKPTGRFRDRVRALRPGDRVTLCGEHERRAIEDGTAGDGNAASADREPVSTLKLEKFAVRGLVETERVVPTCPDCGRSMSSAGRNQGYRCRDCGTAAPGKATREVDRELDPGWYEVPPSARRHVAKPLIRGGFDAPTHPER